MDSFIGGIGYFNALIIFCVLIYIHEMGHYLVAKWCGVRIEVFSIGFGRELFGWTDRSGTRWKISLVPLGGYVRMFGEHGMESMQGETGKALSDRERAASFGHKSLAQRAAIVFAGPAANFVFAIAILATLFGVAGVQEARDFATYGAGSIVPGSAAEAAGMREGDRILAIDGRDIPDWNALVRAVQSSGGRELVMKVDRDGLVRTVRLTPKPDPETRTFMIGIHAPFQVVTFGPGESLLRAAERTWDYSLLTLSAVGEIIIGQRGLDDMGGPVKIVDISNQMAQRGALDLIVFMAVLSINLGLLNLLPIPVLDGGHLMFYFIEAVRGRPLDERKQELLLRAGLALLLALTIVVTLNDLNVFDLVTGTG